MPKITLAAFIVANRDELIGRCRAKVSGRRSPPPTEAEIDQGVPLFLDQLSQELALTSRGDDISKGALDHGRDLLKRGYTIGQVVHDYGDVCQSITDLAVETNASISTDEFRTLNRCLDDAIAGAVTEFAREQDVSREGELSELRGLVNSASGAYDALQTGSVGVRGATGTLVSRSLAQLRAYVERREAAGVQRAAGEVSRPSS